jgi:hypothetical protein
MYKWHGRDRPDVFHWQVSGKIESDSLNSLVCVQAAAVDRAGAR